MLLRVIQKLFDPGLVRARCVVREILPASDGAQQFFMRARIDSRPRAIGLLRLPCHESIVTDNGGIVEIARVASRLRAAYLGLQHGRDISLREIVTLEAERFPAAAT